MGFDTSHHAVDLDLIQTRLIPYILGDHAVDDVIERAVRAAAIRHRANGWGLALTELDLDDKPFDTSLHVWGRPFLIAASPSATIDQYLQAPTEAAVDALARANAAVLAGELPAGLEPDPEGEAIDANGIRWRLDLLKASAAQMRKGGGKIIGSDGEEHDAASLLQREIPLSLLEVAAYTRPGWMTRGFWPTQLDGLADLFEAPEPLLAPFRKAFPKLELFAEPAITENYMVGGWVEASKVPELAARLSDGKGALVAELTEQGWDEAGAEQELQKLQEAVADAAARKQPFAEATEIYSGPGGIIC